MIWKAFREKREKKKNVLFEIPLRLFTMYTFSFKFSSFVAVFQSYFFFFILLLTINIAFNLNNRRAYLMEKHIYVMFWKFRLYGMGGTLSVVGLYILPFLYIECIRFLFQHNMSSRYFLYSFHLYEMKKRRNEPPI